MSASMVEFCVTWLRFNAPKQLSAEKVVTAGSGLAYSASFAAILQHQLLLTLKGIDNMKKTMVATAVAAVLALSACTDNKAPAQAEQTAQPAADNNGVSPCCDCHKSIINAKSAAISRT